MFPERLATTSTQALVRGDLTSTLMRSEAKARGLKRQVWRKAPVKSIQSPTVTMAISGRQQNRTSKIDVPTPQLTYILVPRFSNQPSKYSPT